MAKINGKDILPDVVLPKPKSIKTATKGRFIKNNMREKKLEHRILLALDMYNHIIVWKSGESSVYNSRFNLPGMPDIQGINLKTKEIFFIEAKSKGGVWRDSQVAFMGICEQIGVKYILAYELSDALTVI